ncbi:LapD/MoxY N-terminal periplasmic domain-containing protein [Aquincola sp. MAHUQ-54]|uniref:LapD/MoxY N-terminal periplasmic domain-containing protein n=1 Tax=Aquincola agrisoli TaxID=3119538 RepID=A0AAW9QPQ5_9BURK
MSLIRQLWLLLAAVLALAIVGAVSVNLLSTRAVLQTQLAVKNNDSAQALALVLSQQRGEEELMRLVVAAQADTGFYRSIRFTRSDGRPGIEQQGPAVPLRAPQWFVALLPIDSPPGIAQVSDGWRSLGQVAVVSQDTYAYDELWRGGVRAAWVMLGVGLVAALLSLVVVRRIRAPLEATVRQAQALEQGRYVIVDEPAMPDLRRVASAMNGMVVRMKTLFEAQAAHAEALRRQAHCDALTGLSHRAHFLGQLGALQQREDGVVGGGLVLVRLADVTGLNRAVGRETTDHILQTVAQVLSTYPERVAGCLAGRLNGADFALALPTPGLAAETASAIALALRSSLPSFSTGVRAYVGAVEWARDAAPGVLMAQADLALAQAEAGKPYSAEVLDGTPGDSSVGEGERAWRVQLLSAIEDKAARLRLVDFPVVDRQLQQLHLESPLRVQLQPGGAFEPAARWLPLAMRNRLTALFDAEAVALALGAIEVDGAPRAVNIAPASVVDSGFVAHLRQWLEDRPRLAGSLWLEVPEAAAADHFEAVQAFGRAVRPLGVRFGLEHAGERLHRIDRLFELGLDYVKLDAAVCTGVAASAAGQEFLRSTVALLHALSVSVQVEGVADDADVRTLWECGVDAVTGPWASQR